MNVIVAGPPGAGKSTLAHENAVGEVLDYDEVYAEVTGLPLYEQASPLTAIVEAEFRRRLERFRSGWIVRSAPSKQHRAVLRKLSNAVSVVLEVPAEECLRRIEADPRRSEEAKARGRAGVEWWWLQYQASQNDVPLSRVLLTQRLGG